MGICVKLGEYNKYYKYIIIACIFSFLDDYVIFGFLNQNLISLKIISKETENLYYHSFIYDIFKFLGIFIFSFILFKFKGEYIDTSKISLALFS